MIALWERFSEEAVYCNESWFVGVEESSYDFKWGKSLVINKYVKWVEMHVILKE